MENKKSVIGGGICLILVVGLIYNFMILPNKDDIDNTNRNRIIHHDILA